MARRRFIIFAIVGSIALGAYALGWSSLFTVRHIQITGAPSSTTQEEISNKINSEVPRGIRLARVEPRSLKHSLEEYAWIERSDISRNWIKGVLAIHVWPRTPVAVTGGLFVDNSGKVFALDGVDGSKLPHVVAGSAATRNFAITIFLTLPDVMRSKLNLITAHSIRSATLSVKVSPRRTLQVIWGDSTNMELKTRVYQALIVLPENDKITLVDLSAPHAPIVK